MASKVVRSIQDQNLIVHSDGASVVGKGDALKSIKKGGLGGRKPLGDLSNTGKRQFTKTSKKPGLGDFPVSIAGASNKKDISRTSGKVQINSSRKPLSDAFNTAKPPLQKISSVVAEESCFDFENEGFLHDHNQCTKVMLEFAQKEQIDIFRMIHGPNLSKKLLSPFKASQATNVEEERTYLEEIPESPQFLNGKHDCNTPPLSIDRYTDLPRIWEDLQFLVIGSP